MRRRYRRARHVRRQVLRLRIARTSPLRAQQYPHRGHRYERPDTSEQRQLHARPDFGAVPGNEGRTDELLFRVGVARHADAHRRLHLVHDHNTRNGVGVHPARAPRTRQDHSQGSHLATHSAGRQPHIRQTVDRRGAAPHYPRSRRSRRCRAQGGRQTLILTSSTTQEYYAPKRRFAPFLQRAERKGLFRGSDKRAFFGCRLVGYRNNCYLCTD